LSRQCEGIGKYDKQKVKGNNINTSIPFQNKDHVLVSLLSIEENKVHLNRHPKFSNIKKWPPTFETAKIDRKQYSGETSH
jgi:hypothetical protein